MAKNSKIEWTNHTVNLWWGCSKVHEGCKRCYAETISNRFGDDIWGENKKRKRIKSAFTDLLKYNNQAKLEGKKYRIFCGSMMDIFENSKPLSNPYYHYGEKKQVSTTGMLREILLKEIELGYYDNLIFLFLTKRPENIDQYCPMSILTKDNCWFGTSISSPKTVHYAYKLARINPNLKTFVSVEPQIEMIKAEDWDTEGIDWIIQGGESGAKRRPFDITWADEMRDFCKQRGVPYFFKQIDKKTAIPSKNLIRQFPKF